MSEHEEWRPIPDYEGFYEASSLGRIRSLDRRSGQKFCKGGIIRPSADGVGYTSFALCRGNKKARMKTHRAVCAAFHGSPFPRMDARHLDGNRQNNRQINLAWGTRSQNEQDKFEHGRRGWGEESTTAKLTDAAVLEIRRKVASGITHSRVAAEHGISQTSVSNVVNRKRWQHV